ncbi:unnamed protein product [Darwinula stevensoni]|uniref:Major facilitator superfamily (MFS) profile domain-containing protein n=1 Tax=Darwinula stevensoni TaxID=69355 RepID=A0A7R9A9A1_9CRUS|nr:unnamed protein product [Darwinula stevensoni]CAG0897202.1 unnamed protein product [Darwinula stevensoni]
MTDGVTYTFGIFYVEFLNFYQDGKGATSWIASILVGVTLGSGPIASSLTNKYGCRLVCMGGAVLAFASLAVSVLAPNVATLYLTIGVGAANRSFKHLANK